MAAGNADHGRFRRAFAPAFTEKEVREQEPLIMRHLDILISQLSKETTKGASINLLEWLEYVTFDIAGDLCFSESFRCLESDENRIQIDVLQSAMRAFTQAVIPRVLGLEKAWKLIVPRISRQKRMKYYKTLNDWTHQRLDEGDNPDKNDLMTFVHRRSDKKALSLVEIENALGDFMVAGSETVATTLAALFYHLARAPDVSRQLNVEILKAVNHESEITGSLVSELPYLNAAINEAMRLCPSLPTAMPRIIPEQGATTCGHWLPGGVSSSYPYISCIIMLIETDLCELQSAGSLLISHKFLLA